MSGYDSVVTFAFQQNASQGDTEGVLASLVTTLGVTKCQEYKYKSPILRDYVKLQSKIELPFYTAANYFVVTMYAYSTKASIDVPDLDPAANGKVMFIMFHIICMQNCLCTSSPNSDGLFALSLYAPPPPALF